jgi:hypothetical protein
MATFIGIILNIKMEANYKRSNKFIELISGYNSVEWIRTLFHCS